MKSMLSLTVLVKLELHRKNKLLFVQVSINWVSCFSLKHLLSETGVTMELSSVRLDLVTALRPPCLDHIIYTIFATCKAQRKPCTVKTYLVLFEPKVITILLSVLIEPVYDPLLAHMPLSGLTSTVVHGF